MVFVEKVAPWWTVVRLMVLGMFCSEYWVKVQKVDLCGLWCALWSEGVFAGFDLVLEWPSAGPFVI